MQPEVQTFVVVARDVFSQCFVEMLDGFRYAIKALFLGGVVEAFTVGIVIGSADSGMRVDREDMIGKPLRELTATISLEGFALKGSQALRSVLI
jgi:hypothetical protein